MVLALPTYLDAMLVLSSASHAHARLPSGLLLGYNISTRCNSHYHLVDAQAPSIKLYCCLQTIRNNEKHQLSSCQESTGFKQSWQTIHLKPAQACVLGSIKGSNTARLQTASELQTPKKIPELKNFKPQTLKNSPKSHHLQIAICTDIASGKKLLNF